MEQTRGDGDVVHSHLDQDAGDFEGVNEIGFTRQPLLPVVALRRIDVRALEQLEIDARVVLEHAIGDVVEAKHTLPHPPAGSPSEQAPLPPRTSNLL